MCHNSGICGTGNTHVKYRDKQNIQHGIQHNRNQKKQQGGGAVAHSPQNTGKQIVQIGGEQARQDNAQVGDTVGEYIRRCLHHGKQWF